jgi:hypothetical protein
MYIFERGFCASEASANAQIMVLRYAHSSIILYDELRLSQNYILRGIGI